MYPKKSEVYQTLECDKNDRMKRYCYAEFSLITNDDFEFELGDELRFKVLAGTDEEVEGEFQATTVLYALEPSAPTNLQNDKSITN